jgi:hypothetical protein
MRARASARAPACTPDLPRAAIDWLLEPENPTVRFLALTELLGRSGRHPEVREARALLLLDLGCRDERMQEAIALVRSRRGADGRWVLQDTFNGRFQVDVEQKGEPSKWITLNALRVLKGAGALEG